MAPSCLDKFWKWSKITYCTSKILHRSNQLKGWSQQVGYPYRQLTSSPAPGELSIFEALQILVDLGETPFQMATAVRAVRPEAPDWFHLVALIHDLGKMMALPQLAGKEWMGISDLEILCEAWCLRIQMLGRKTAHLLANTHTHTQQLFEVRSPGCLGNFGVTDFVNDDNENCTSRSRMVTTAVIAVAGVAVDSITTIMVYGQYLY